MTMRKHSYPRSFGLVLVVGLLFLLSSRPGRADLLPIDLNPSPVILSINGTLNYNATTGNLHSDTMPLALTLDALPMGFAFINGGLTTIDLRVDTSGRFVANGA